MKTKYDELYKQLVESYYHSDFEATLSKLLEHEFSSKEEAKEILSALCGVDNPHVSDDFEFTKQIIDSITRNRVRQKIVQKVQNCSEDCEDVDGKSKCQSVCPFNAIVKNLMTDDKFIDPDLCISCGKCVSVCDKGNYLDTKEFLPLAGLLEGEDKVVAIVAPAIAGQFGEDVTLDQLREAFIKIGFTDMVEVAMAADVLSFKEATEFNEHIMHAKENTDRSDSPIGSDITISSCCCPVWVAMLRKVYYDFIDNVTPSVSPMIAMGRILKALNPDAKVVFIGPCIAKKAEAKEQDICDAVDFVLTFQEVKAMFEVANVDPSKLGGVPSVDYAATGGKLYGRAGGVSEAVYDVVHQLYPESRKHFNSVQASGVPNCKKLLEQLRTHEIKATFVEGMGCPGGCVGGPKRIVDVEVGKEAVNQEAYSSAIKVPVNSEVLKSLLRQIGVKDVNSLNDVHSMFERDFH